MQMFYEDEQVSMFAPDLCAGKMSPAHSPAGSKREMTSESSWRKRSELVYQEFMFLKITLGDGDILGQPYWEILSPYVGESSTLNTGVCPRVVRGSSLWQILEPHPQRKYYLSRKACLGILRRARKRGKELPATLKLALEMQSGLRMIDLVILAQMDNHQPLIFESHGMDARYRQMGDVAPTMSARYGTGGNNVPLVGEQVFCITGNAIDREPENGGNGIGYQENVSYTLTGFDRHAVCSVSEVVGALCKGDEKGAGSQYVEQGKCVVDLYTCEPAGDKDLPILLIRRLTPLECERLQGFPDGWTDIPGASDSARYKALGNSVAIPCVDFVMKCMADAIRGSG